MPRGRRPIEAKLGDTGSLGSAASLKSAVWAPLDRTPTWTRWEMADAAWHHASDTYGRHVCQRASPNSQPVLPLPL